MTSATIQHILAISFNPERPVLNLQSPDDSQKLSTLICLRDTWLRLTDIAWMNICPPNAQTCSPKALVLVVHASTIGEDDNMPLRNLLIKHHQLRLILRLSGGTALGTAAGGTSMRTPSVRIPQQEKQAGQ